MNDLFSSDVIFSAYKKLKHYFYYDNTSLFIKQRISKFEDGKLQGNGLKEIKNSLSVLMQPILRLTRDSQKDFFKGIDTLEDLHLDYQLIPKKIKKKSYGIITNIQTDKELYLERVNVFADASVEIHLISVLWLMFAGRYLRKKISADNYAYELQINENDDEERIVDGLRLYKPYFIQYQKWRDNAIATAEDLIKNKKDVTILSLDIKDYFHTVDVNLDNVKKEIIDLIEKKIQDASSEISKRQYLKDKDRVEVLSTLLQTIHLVYSEKINTLEANINQSSSPLPIGLMSSGMLGNYYLHNFDEEIIEKLNPSYYGRYVDDLMFVFPNLKIEHDSISPINSFLDKYFVNRGLLSYKSYDGEHPTDIFFAKKENQGKEIKIFHKENKDVIVSNDCIRCLQDELDYKRLVASKIELNLHKLNNLVIQSEKVILHYFDHKESKAALNKFKKRLEEQRSEFRFLPDEDKISGEFDEEAFSLQYNDSINKFRSIQELSEDKYGASKFLAKKIFARNYGDGETDEETDNQILTFFKGFVGITFYSLWEKVTTYFIVSNRIDNLIKFKRNIIKSIYRIDLSSKSEAFKRKVTSDLENFLQVSIAIPLALNPGVKFEYINEDEKMFFNGCRNKANHIRKSNLFRQALVYIPAINYTNYANLLEGTTNLLDFKEDIIQAENVEKTEVPSLLKLSDRLSILSPRYVYFHELNIKKIYEVVSSISSTSEFLKDLPSGITDSQNERIDIINNIPNDSFSDYWKLNYDWRTNKKEKEEELRSRYFEINHSKKCGGTDEYHIDIKGNDKNVIIDKRIAIANVKVSSENYLGSIKEKPNLSRQRRQEFFSLLNQAESHRSDIFVMPEVSVPFSWIKLLGYTSHKRNVAIVAGLEHWINRHGFAFNFMVTILPIKLDDYTTSIIKIRLKNHYAHDEKELLKGYRLLIPRDTIKDYPKSYDLFHWRNVYFSVYNCFELADISDRSLFKSKVDFIVAAEFNRDVNYFSDIAGSWVRDVHCYFIQVNTSQYGDSRLIQPSKSYAKDLIQIKGGINSAILIGELKIKKLRDFQLVEYNLQKEEIDTNRTDLKPTPPDYDRKNVEVRINNKSFF